MVFLSDETEIAHEDMRTKVTKGLMTNGTRRVVCRSEMVFDTVNCDSKRECGAQALPECRGASRRTGCSLPLVACTFALAAGSACRSALSEYPDVVICLPSKLVYA